MNTKVVFQLDHQGFLLGETTADESPLEPGVFLLPAGCVELPPPTIPEGKLARFDDGAWVLVDLPQPEPDPEPEPPTPDVLTRAQMVVGVDDYISDIYSRFTRFETEYVSREAAARAFIAAEYAGDPGIWVTAFATSAGLSNQAAADLIVSQADNLRGALIPLGALRMRKYEVAAAPNDAAGRVIYDIILAQAHGIASTL